MQRDQCSRVGNVDLWLEDKEIHGSEELAAQYMVSDQRVVQAAAPEKHYTHVSHTARTGVKVIA